jgi:hypothetical protein
MDVAATLMGIHMIVAIFASGELAQSPSCRALEPMEIERRVSRMEQLPVREMVDEIGLLTDYWQGVCIEHRRNAGAPVVASLARLLQRQPARMGVSALLLDVGRNLRIAKRPLRSALADEIRRDRESLRATWPIRATTYRRSSDTLRCVLRKMRTNREDRELCLIVNHMRVPAVGAAERLERVAVQAG